MNARPLRDIDRATVEALIAASGVSANSGELDAITRSLARMQNVSAGLLQASSFDEAIERFYRLLDDDAGEGTGR